MYYVFSSYIKYKFYVDIVLFSIIGSLFLTDEINISCVMYVSWKSALGLL